MNSRSILILACITILLTASSSAQEDATTTSSPLLPPPPTPPSSKLPFRVRHQDSYAIEVLTVLLGVAILFTMYTGRKKNRQLAVRYVAELIRPQGVLLRQYADAESEVIAEAPDVYKFYASGRRYCQGVLMTFRLASRQDLSALLRSPSARDVLEIEVNMNENSMPLTVFFIATPSAAKNIIKENRDVGELTKKIEPTRDRLPGWNSEALVVHAEQASVFYDIITQPLMDSFFGVPAFEQVAPFFQSVYCSSEFRAEAFREDAVGATGKRPVIKMTFSLPPPGNYDLLDTFITGLGLLIDGLGTCKLTPDQMKKATEARRKAEAKREDAKSERERRLEEKRAAKEQEERLRLSKLPPEVREKERAKKEKILKQRRMKSLAKRI